MNEKLAVLFDQLSVQFKRDRYRCMAYKKAALAIRSYPNQIKSGYQAKNEINGIGQSIATKIDEFIETGELTIINDIPPEQKERDRVTKIFEGIYGVGTVTAEKWYDQGYRSLEDLRQIYGCMTDGQKLGYCYYYHLQKRIPRKEIDIYNTLLSKVIPGDFLICGSYRRGEPTSGDIDCLVKSSNALNLKTILSNIVSTGIIIGNLAIGTTKYMGICRLDEKHCARRIDILIVEPESWPYATLYFTGSKTLNIMMRVQSLKLGMKLSEYSMMGNGKNYIVSSEEEIFALLGMKYLEPHERSIGHK